MIRAASLPIEINLLRFSQFLHDQRVVHRINEESGQQVIWVQDEQHAMLVRDALAEWSFDEATTSHSSAASQSQSASMPMRGLNALLRACWQAPISFMLILACLLVAVVSLLGSEVQRVAGLFYPLLDTAGFFALLGSMDSLGDVARSLTPILLHFGELHLVFNMLWLWYFGSQLESVQPRYLYLVLIILCAFVGNTTQYLYSGYNNFGGMSGVVYGLVGYAWVTHAFMPQSPLLINNRMFVVFVIALLAMELFASSWIASAAHVGGLIAGLIWGMAVVLLYRFVLGRRAIGS